MNEIAEPKAPEVSTNVSCPSGEATNSSITWAEGASLVVVPSTCEQVDSPTRAIRLASGCSPKRNKFSIPTEAILLRRLFSQKAVSQGQHQMLGLQKIVPLSADSERPANVPPHLPSKGNRPPLLQPPHVTSPLTHAL